MEFVLKPSLKHMALVKIVITLWNQNDVWSLISEPGSSNLYSSEKWKKIEKTVIEKVSLLPLPHLLKEKVLDFTKPIGIEVSMWMEYNYKYLQVNLPAELCWTPEGTVDRRRTAEVLVRNGKLDVSTCYKLACNYCLEDDILKLWNNMPEDLKESVSNKSPIISFWSRNMKRNGLGNAHISYNYVFQQSVCLDNKVAAEYFLQKLNPQEREKSLVETAKYIRDGDTLYFLISEMNEGQQNKVFKENPYSVLRCFLRWPLQSFLIGVANCMWDFLSKDDYDDILTEVIVKANDGYSDWNYQELFREFWQKSPNVQKNLFIDEIHSSWLLQSLFRFKDKENIRLILKDANLAAKENLIYSDEIIPFWQRSIRDNEWDFLEFFIRECLPSKNAMLKFKEKFEKRMYFKESASRKKHKWNQLFVFSGESICKYGKRSVEEGESSSSKQFRSLE